MNEFTFEKEYFVSKILFKSLLSHFTKTLKNIILKKNYQAPHIFFQRRVILETALISSHNRVGDEAPVHTLWQ